MSYFSLFQSTHPARGATRSGFLTPTVDQFQSTHPARGATFRCLDKKPLFGFQSTHPARGATRRYVCTNEGWRFQSTHPARGATGHIDLAVLALLRISIHAPREGCDVQIGRRAQDDAKHFNPRTPRGVRPLIMDAFIANANFNPRTPRGVRRTTGVYLGIPQRFQSTHPARGATIGIPAGHNPLLYFNPRTPRGVRRYLTATLDAQTSISIHAPREGCDVAFVSPCPYCQGYFNPRTPRGVRPAMLHI